MCALGCMYEPLQSCDALWKVRTRRAQSVFWRCEHADEGGSNPRMRHLGSVCRARSPHSCELCLGHPVRSPQSALAVRIPANPASDTPFAVRSPHSQSAFRPSLFGGPVRSPQSALAVRTRTEIRDGICPLLGGPRHVPSLISVGMRTASADCGLRTGCTSQGSQEQYSCNMCHL